MKSGPLVLMILVLFALSACIEPDPLEDPVDRLDDSDDSDDQPAEDPEEPTEPTPDPIVPGEGLTGAYFDSTSEERLLVRTDATVDFDWHFGSPDPSVPEDYFSAVWTGDVRAPEPGDYIFSVRVDDGFRLFVDGELVAESWMNQGGPRGEEPLYDSIPVSFGDHALPIRLEYYEAHSTAVVRLYWRELGEDASQMRIIEEEFLYPGAAAVSMSQGAVADPEATSEPEEPVLEPPQTDPGPVFDGTYGPRDVARSRTPASGDTFVSRTGSGDQCTQQNPCSLTQGISNGGHIWMNPGVYTHSGQLNLGSNRILESIDPNDKAVIDFQESTGSRLVLLDSNVLRNIVVRRSAQVGIVLWGDNNLLEGVIAERNYGSGIHLFPVDSQYSDLINPTGASNNVIRDTIARYNNDRCRGTGASTCTLSDSDGISISAGRGNLIEYSAAYSNTDDGFDFWRSYMGTIRYSVAYGNGYNELGNRAGHGNGFKMGSGEGPVPNNHLISSNWAYGNVNGFIRNSGEGSTFENNVCGESQDPCGPAW